MRPKGFNPEAVKFEHIKPITFLYGKDVPGMTLRLGRFEEILVDEGYDLHRYSTLDSDAIGYIQAGDLFSGDICVSVHDIGPILGSSSESKRKRKTLCQAISTYSDTESRFVFAAETSNQPKALQEFISFVVSQGGVAREVAAPSSREMSNWIKEYLSSTGRMFPSSAIELTSSIANGDVNIAKTILDNIGEEVTSMSQDDVAEWLDIDRNLPLIQVYNAICERNIDKLVSYRKTFSAGTSGQRLFLLKLRYVAFDLMLLTSCDNENLKPFFEYKTAQYGRAGINAQQVRQTALQNGDAKRYANLYWNINEALARISGASSKEFSYSKLYADIVA